MKSRVEVRALRSALGGWLRARVVDTMSPLRHEHAAAREDLGDLRAAALAVEYRVSVSLARLDRAPFIGSLGVHAAHHRHPGVQGVFARHGLPRCLDCAVGADETLSEAAFGEGLQLDALLTELDALLGAPR